MPIDLATCMIWCIFTSFLSVVPWEQQIRLWSKCLVETSPRFMETSSQKTVRQPDMAMLDHRINTPEILSAIGSWHQARKMLFIQTLLPWSPEQQQIVLLPLVEESDPLPGNGRPSFYINEHQAWSINFPHNQSGALLSLDTLTTVRAENESVIVPIQQFVVEMEQYCTFEKV